MIETETTILGGLKVSVSGEIDYGEVEITGWYWKGTSKSLPACMQDRISEADEEAAIEQLLEQYQGDIDNAKYDSKYKE